MPKQITIQINGVDHQVPDERLTYERIAELAEVEGQPAITWRRADRRAGGSICAGFDTAIAPLDGMVFTVVEMAREKAAG